MRSGNYGIIAILFFFATRRVTPEKFEMPTKFVEQSNPCSPEENAKQIQCLREIPAERYEVLEGEDVQMRCRVAHQKGKTQWRAGNFLLGHSRSIPGWERYSLQGDPQLGIHDLLIKNVTNKDAGIFECQVSPADGQAPLRRQASLYILAKPSVPIIVTPAGEPQPSTDGQLTVALQWSNTSSNEDANQQSLCLFCQSKGGNPEPNFEWFHNGRLTSGSEALQYHGNRATLTTESILKNNIEEVEHFSELCIEKKKLETGDRIACVVSNKATLRANKLSEQKLRAELLINVHVAPGNPEIIDWMYISNRSQIFNSGSSLEATCRSLPAGIPPGELTWRFEKENSQIKFGIIQSTPKSLPLPPRLINISPSQIIEQYTDEKLLSKVSVPNLNSTFHGLELVCGVKHPVGPEQSTRVKILVRHSPERIYIEGPSDSLIKIRESIQSRSTVFSNDEFPLINESPRKHLHIYLDRPQYLLCLTSSYFDQASIKWFGYSNITDQWQELTAIEAKAYPLETETKKYIFASIIQTVSTNSGQTHSWNSVKCVSEAINEEGNFATGNEVIHQLQLHRFEPPSKPFISGYNQNTMIPEYEKITLRCEASPGEPIGRLTWISDFYPTKELAEQLRSAKTFQEHPAQIYSTVQLTAMRKYNGLTLRCASENAGYPVSDKQTSSPLKLNVAFSANKLNLSVSDEFGRTLFSSDSGSNLLQTVLPTSFNNSTHPAFVTVDAETAISVTCQTQLSNPPSEIHWVLYKCMESHYLKNISKPLRQNETDEPCKKEYLTKEDNSIVAKLLVQSTVRLRLNWSHHGSILECSSRPKRGHLDTTSIDTFSDPPRHSQSTHGQSILSERLLLRVRFKPTFVRQAEQLKWPVGLNPDQITQLPTPQFITSEGGSVDLDLEPYANPPIDKFLWWKDQEHLIGTNDMADDYRVVIRGSRLQIRSVQVIDMGNYTLTAKNIMGSGTFQFFLNVTYAPQLIGSSATNLTASGPTALLECEAIGNPPPIESALRWLRLPHKLLETSPWVMTYSSITEPEEIVRNSEDAFPSAGIGCNKHSNQARFGAKCWNPRVGVLKSVLTINDLKPTDVGRYQCRMDNAVGSPAVKHVDLIYPFAPRVISIPRWNKAAPTNLLPVPEHTNAPKKDSHEYSVESTETRLTCVISAEPRPTVEWMREPSNLTLVEGGQFRMTVKSIHPGLYKAVLYISQSKVTDRGKYFCKASNLVGWATGSVEFVDPSLPDQPNMPRLINATSTSMTVGWTQGYNGGPTQVYHLRWASNDHPTDFKEVDVPEDLESEMLVYTLKGLQKATTYRIALSASNAVFGSTAFTPYILASTKAADPITDSEAMRDEARAKSRSVIGEGHWNSMTSGEHRAIKGQTTLDIASDRDEAKASSIIVAASVFGATVLIANLLVVLLLAHRKRRKMKQIRKNSAISMHDAMKLRSTGHSYTDMGGIHQTSYAAYADGASLTGEVLMHSRSTDQFSPFHSEFTHHQLSMNSADHPLTFFNAPYTGSPHSSLQALNPMLLSGGNQMDLTGEHPDCTGDSDRAAQAYFNRETNYPFLDGTQHMAPFTELQAPELLLGGMMAERRTPVSIRWNPNTSVYSPIQRVESPQSGHNSCISGPRSTGYPNTNSLERLQYNQQVRASSTHYGQPVFRQSSFRHYVPNGVFNKTAGDYGAVCAQGNFPGETLTPNQTLFNYRTRQNLMASSYYADRGMETAIVYPENGGKGETVLSNGSIVRRGSYNQYKPKDMLLPKESSPMKDLYVQRYNDQLQSVRAMNRHFGVSKISHEFEKDHTLYSINSQVPSDSFVIPPPNAFGTSNVHRNSHQISTAVSDNPNAQAGDQSNSPENGNAVHGGTSYKEVKFASVAPVKRPTPEQNLFYTEDDRTDFSQYGSMV